MFNLLILLSLLASNAYEVASVTVDSSFLTQLGYNNQSSDVNIGSFNITDIDPNVFKGYTNLTRFAIGPSRLSKIDLGMFKDSVKLQEIVLTTNPSLIELTNSKKIVFPFMRRLFIWGCSLTNLDSNVISALPNLTNLETPFDNWYKPLRLEPHQLSSLKKLSYLYIGMRNQSSLTKEHFSGLNSLTDILFLDSHIKTIEVHTLLALPNLVYADFSNNDITAFEYLQIPPKLIQLKLSGNKMNYFMLSRTMENIKFLYLDNNLFRSFKSMNFTFLVNVIVLDLSNNPHAYPNEIGGHMKPLVNLYGVWLNNLSISAIDSNFFKYNKMLASIFMNNNKISAISHDAFVNSKRLSDLDLSYNQISVLDNRTFFGLDNLGRIYLHFNKLTKISSRTFSNMSLQFLFLSNNLISKIENSAFSGLIVQYFYLSYNNISSIGPDTFNNSNIQNLYLSNNRLTKLVNGTFVGLTNLKYIELKNNMISSIDSGAFNGLTNLQYIYLDANNITQLDSSTFSGCNNLQGIYLYNNPSLSTSNVQSLCPTTATSCTVYY